MAKEVFLSIPFIFCCGRETLFSSLNWAKGGNSSAPKPRILKKLAAERKDETFLSSTSSSTSELASSRSIPTSFLTGIVVAPDFLTAASTEQVMVTSRSVAVSSSRLPSARSRTLERMGKVVLVLTTFCTDWSPAKSWSLAMLRFIGPFTMSLAERATILILRAVNSGNGRWCQGHARNLGPKRHWNNLGNRAAQQAKGGVVPGRHSLFTGNGKVIEEVVGPGKNLPQENWTSRPSPLSLPAHGMCRS